MSLAQESSTSRPATLGSTTERTIHFNAISPSYKYQKPISAPLSMSFFTSVRSFRLNNPAAILQDRELPGIFLQQPLLPSAMASKTPPHSAHPDFLHLILLVFEAVLEVVCVSLPGYIVARQGMFNADMQKFAANLNVMLFTPCLSESEARAFRARLTSPQSSPSWPLN